MTETTDGLVERLRKHAIGETNALEDDLYAAADALVAAQARIAAMESERAAVVAKLGGQISGLLARLAEVEKERDAAREEVERLKTSCGHCGELEQAWDRADVAEEKAAAAEARISKLEAGLREIIDHPAAAYMIGNIARSLLTPASLSDKEQKIMAGALRRSVTKVSSLSREGDSECPVCCGDGFSPAVDLQSLEVWDEPCPVCSHK